MPVPLRVWFAWIRFAYTTACANLCVSRTLGGSDTPERYRTQASAASAFGTVSSGLTGDHAPSIRPCSSTRNDERMSPTEVVPPRTFSPHAPHASAVAWSGSESNGNPSLYLSSNASCLSGRSGEILPMIPEVARLDGAPGRVGLGVEVDEELPAAVALEAYGGAVLVLELEGRRR